MGLSRSLDKNCLDWKSFGVCVCVCAWQLLGHSILIHVFLLPNSQTWSDWTVSKVCIFYVCVFVCVHDVHGIAQIFLSTHERSVHGYIPTLISQKLAMELRKMLIFRNYSAIFARGQK